MNRRRLFVLLRVLVSAVLLSWLLWRLDWKRVFDTLQEADTALLLLAPVLWLISLVAASFRWTLLLRDGKIILRFRDALAAYLIGAFYNIFLPGAIAGDTARATVCSFMTGCGISRAAGSVLLERLSGLMAVLVFIFSTSILFPGTWLKLLGSGSPGIITIMSSAALLIGAAAAGSRSLLILLAERMDRGRILSAFGRLLRMLAGVTQPALFRSLLLSMLYQGMRFIGIFILARSIGLPLSLDVFFSLMPLVYLATLIPVSLGGLGVREGTMVILLAGFGIVTSQAVTLSLLVYLNLVLLALIGGVLQSVKFKARRD